MLHAFFFQQMIFVRMVESRWEVVDIRGWVFEKVMEIEENVECEKGPVLDEQLWVVDGAIVANILHIQVDHSL